MASWRGGSVSWDLGKEGEGNQQVFFLLHQNFANDAPVQIEGIWHGERSPTGELPEGAEEEARVQAAHEAVAVWTAPVCR